MSDPYHLHCLREREAELLAKIESLRLELGRVQDEMQHPDKWSIDVLEISIRAYNCLKNTCVPNTSGHCWSRPTLDINTVGDLLQWSETDLLKIKNLGRGTLQELKSRLSDIGLALHENGTDG